MQSKGSYAYGGYPGIDDLFQGSSRSSTTSRSERRSSTAHVRPRDVHDRDGSAHADGRGPEGDRAHDHPALDEPVPFVGGHEDQSAIARASQADSPSWP